MTWLWKALAAVLAAAAAILGVLFSVNNRQKQAAEAKAEDFKQRAESAKASIEQRDRARDASQKAKEEGDADVEKVRDRARRGHRDHFGHGMRDDD